MTPVSPGEGALLAALREARTAVPCASLSARAGLTPQAAWRILQRFARAGTVTVAGDGLERVYQLTRAGAAVVADAVVVHEDMAVVRNHARTVAASGRDGELARQILEATRRHGWPAAWPDRWRDIALARAGHPGSTWAEVGAALGVSRDVVAGAFARLYTAAADEGYLTGRMAFS